MYKWLILALLTGSFSALADSDSNKTPATSRVKSEQVQLATHTQDGKLILGEKEWVYVNDLNRNVLARVDTGATTSSISATHIKIYKDDGQDMVEFKLAHKKWSSKETFILPVARYADVRQSSTENLDQRPVVELEIQLGDHKTSTEFSLVDRSHLRYPVLLGRTFIDEQAIVDVSHKYIQPRIKHEKKAAQANDKSVDTSK